MPHGARIFSFTEYYLQLFAIAKFPTDARRTFTLEESLKLNSVGRSNFQIWYRQLSVCQSGAQNVRFEIEEENLIFLDYEWKWMSLKNKPD